MPDFIVDTNLDIVDGSDGLTSLREALTLANANVDADIITFDAGLSGQTIHLQSVLDIVQGNVTINGDVDGDDAADITISGDSNQNGSHDAGDTSLLIVQSGADVTLNGLEFTDGHDESSTFNVDGIAGITNSGNLTISNSALSNNKAVGFMPPIPSGSYFAGTSAIAGIANLGAASELTISDTVFENNSAIGGSSPRAPEFIEGGYDGYAGGNSTAGIFNEGLADLANVNFVGNMAAGGDGGRGSDGYCYRFSYSCNDVDGGNGGVGGDASTGILNASGGTLSGNAVSIGGSATAGSGGGFGVKFGSTAVDGVPGVDGNADTVLVIQGGDVSGFTGVNGNLIDGTAGNNLLIGTQFDDVIKGFAGNDILRGGQGDDVLDGGANGTAGDTADYSDALSSVRVFLSDTDGQNTLGSGFDTHIGIENLTGSAFSDRFFGDIGDNVFKGMDGNDVISGNGGTDTFHGGDGNDRLTGAAGVDVMFGDDGNDILFALSGLDILNGGKGDDFLYGGGDSDILNGNRDNDKVKGNLGNDTLNGGGGIDDLRGGGGNDALDGDSGRDFLFGENGRDILSGGSGNDSLTGGAGAGSFDGMKDTFVYANTASGAGGFDRIKDWEDGTDIIDLTSFGFGDFATEVLTLASNTSDGMRINFGGGDVLFLENFDVADFDVLDVLLV